MWKHILFVMFMTAISPLLGLLTLLFFAVIYGAAEWRRRAGTMSGLRPARSEREAFNGRLQEAEFAAINNGPTLLGGNQ